jgi:hypothetical protein
VGPIFFEGIKGRLIRFNLQIELTPLAMSALGQKRTWRDQISMSALPPKADIVGAK